MPENYVAQTIFLGSEKEVTTIKTIEK